MNNNYDSKYNDLKIFNEYLSKIENDSESDIDNKKPSLREDNNDMNDNINNLHNDMMKTINDCKTLIANLNDIIKAIEIEEKPKDIQNNNITNNSNNTNNSKAKNIYNDKETINKNNYFNENINKIKRSATEYRNQNAYTERYLSNKNAFSEALHELLDNYYETHDIDDIDDTDNKNYNNLIDENEDEYIKYYSQPVEYNNPCNKDCYTCDSFNNCPYPYNEKENNTCDCKENNKTNDICDNSCKSKCNNKCEHECECDRVNDKANNNVTDRLNEVYTEKDMTTKDITLYVHDEIYDGVRNIEYYCDTCDGQSVSIEGTMSRAIEQPTTLDDIRQIYNEVVHGLLFDKPNIKYKFKIFYNNIDVSACIINNSLCTSK